jgi:hypothetical protein
VEIAFDGCPFDLDGLEGDDSLQVVISRPANSTMETTISYWWVRPLGDGEDEECVGIRLGPIDRAKVHDAMARQLQSKNFPADHITSDLAKELET